MTSRTGWLAAFGLLLLCSITASQTGAKDPSSLTTLFGDTFLALESLTRMFTGILGMNDTRKTRSLMGQKTMSRNYHFMCDTNGFRSETPPESVHRLMPGDVDVVAAMGDSLTAGNGAFATNIPQLLINNRGISWSIGGEETWRSCLTLPNILKEFNPRLTGYSLGKGFSYSRSARFNVAVAGAIDDDIVYQAKILVKRMRADPKVNMQKHWKVITMTIGSNDICIFACYDHERHSGEMHLKAIREALDYLHDNIPRALVNLVLVPDILALHRIRNKPRICEMAHTVECPCLFGVNLKSKIEYANQTLADYRRVERELVNSGRYDTRDDFTVVLQVFTEVAVTEDEHEKGLMALDMSLFAVDCFHLSQRGNAYAANALWNNMMEPEGEKSKYWGPEFKTVKCPTKEMPYIFTTKNSKEYLNQKADNESSVP